MHTVAVLSLKGGVGKTTVALGIASAAVHRGARTLVVDLDPQGNATSSLDAPDADRSLDDVLRGSPQLDPRAALVRSPWGDGLDVLGGSEELDLPGERSSAGHSATALADALGRLGRVGAWEDEPSGSGYDVVVLDCPPSLGTLTRSALLAANSALLVSEPSMYAIAGATRALEAIETIQAEHNPALRPAGVLVNRFRARSAEHRFRIDELREEFGNLVMPSAIPDRSVLQQAQGACAPIHQWDSPAAQEISLTFNMVLAKLLRSDRAGRHRGSGLDAADDSFPHNPEHAPHEHHSV